MPTAPSIWTALIAAAAAVAGVLIAQALTSRREKRQWEHQMQMYATQWADQCDRDREQREDQRALDEIQRRREEARRFVDQRREMYAEFLTEATKIEEAIDNQIFHWMQRDDEAKEIRRTNLRPVLRQIKDHLWGKLNAFRLVAPEPVVDQTRRYTLRLIEEISILGTDNTIPDDFRESRRNLLDRMRAAMREDVTGSISHPPN